jgi:hypothetical protein
MQITNDEVIQLDEAISICEDMFGNYDMGANTDNEIFLRRIVDEEMAKGTSVSNIIVMLDNDFDMWKRVSDLRSMDEA